MPSPACPIWSAAGPSVPIAMLTDCWRRGGLSCLLEAVCLSVVRMTHFSTALFPLIAGVRLWRRRRAANGNGAQAPSDLRPLPPWLNRALLGVAMTERRVLRHLNLPFGSSILGIARKGN